MKQLMIDTMAAMMPFMRPLTFIAAGLIVIGVLAGLISRASQQGAGVARGCGVFTLAAGIFFLACDITGRFLGFAPTILYADPLDRELFRNQWPFWMVGLGLVLAGFAVRALARRVQN